MAKGPEKTAAEQAAHDAAVYAAAQIWDHRPKDLEDNTDSALWEALWEAFDFSWDGLADAGWDRGDDANEAQELKRWRAPLDVPGGGTVHGEGENGWKEASLQDYWRWSLGIAPDADGDQRGETLLTDRQLVKAGLLHADEDGKLWHILHLRPNAALAKTSDNPEMRSEARSDGAENTGAGGDWLAPPILARLAAAGHVEDGPDMRLRLIGARAPGLNGFLIEFADREENTEEPAPVFIDAALAEFDYVDVTGAQFRGPARFDRAQFRGPARFDDAQFRHMARFHRARFTDFARFDGTQFRDMAQFDQTQFWDMARFDHAQFWGPASFAGAQFRGMAWLESAQFRDRAGFGGAQFRDITGFGEAKFSGPANFDEAQFWGRARFGRAQFRDRAKFDRAQFRGRVEFIRVVFGDEDATGSIHFQTAVFEKLADFSGARFPHQPERIQSAFETARFLEEARFKTPDFTAFAAFDGAVFRGRLLLAPADTEREEQQRFDAVLRATEAAVRTDRQVVSAENYDLETDRQSADRGPNIRFAALEGGLRVLKSAMEAEKDHMPEHRFFRFELQAKRRRPSVSWLEKVASKGYGVFSDYGNSMGRPIVALLLSVLLLGATYWGWGRTLDPSFNGMEKAQTALEFSIRNVVQPFAPWTATKWSPLNQLEIIKVVKAASCGVAPDVEPAGVAKAAAETTTETGTTSTASANIDCSPDGFGWLAFRLLATLQSVFSLLLVFLFALALRKKFQIS